MLSSLKSGLAYTFWTSCGIVRKWNLRHSPLELDSLNFDCPPEFRTVAVVGRSESAATLINYGDFDLTILVNFTDSDMLDPAFRQRIILCKRVVLLHNSMERAISYSLFKKMNVKAVVWIGFSPSSNNPRKRKTWRLNKFGRDVQYLPKDPGGRTSISGGGAGIAGLALASTLSKEVHAFGIDFHKVDYLHGSIGKRDALTLGNKFADVFGPMRERAFQDLANMSPEVSFTFHSTITLQSSLPNAHSVRETMP